MILSIKFDDTERKILEILHLFTSVNSLIFICSLELYIETSQWLKFLLILIFKAYMHVNKTVLFLEGT